jgi:hypothetical protein
LVDILTFDGFFARKIDILKPRWLPTALAFSHAMLNLTAGEKMRSDLHIQTISSRHSRLKDFLRRHRGTTNKFLTATCGGITSPSYLAVPHPAPSSLRRRREC